MALPSTGALKMSDVAVELGLAATTQLALNDSRVRTLAGKSSGGISFADLRGKSALSFSAQVFPKTDTSYTNRYYYYDYYYQLVITTNPPTAISGIDAYVEIVPRIDGTGTATYSKRITTLDYQTVYTANTAASKMNVSIAFGALTTANGVGTQIITLRDTTVSGEVSEGEVMRLRGSLIYFGSTHMALPTNGAVVTYTMENDY